MSPQETIWKSWNKTMKLIWFFALLLLSAVSCAAPPNIVIILADDLGHAISAAMAVRFTKRRTLMRWPDAG